MYRDLVPIWLIICLSLVVIAITLCISSYQNLELCTKIQDKEVQKTCLSPSSTQHDAK